MANKELSEKQLQAIELLVKGETITDIANIIGVSRISVSNWKNNNEVFKAELDKSIQMLKSNVDSKILSNIEPLIDKLIKIALKSSSDKTSLDAIIYALNRVLGTPTNKSQEVNDGSNKNSAPVNIEEMLCQINVDNTLDSKGNDPI